MKRFTTWIFVFLSPLLFAWAGQFAFAASVNGTIGVNATVSENITISTGEGDTGLDVMAGDGTTDKTDVTYTATMDSSTLSESEGYDSFTDEYNPQLLNEDFSVKNTCKSVNTGENQAPGELQTYNVTITW